MENHTMATEFILVGFMGKPEMQSVLFVLFLIMYNITMMGNIGMILIINADSKLHTPMYFFLKNLSFLDICYSSVITPKAIVSFATGNKAISYNGCATQMFFFTLFATTEAFFLAVMAYDRFVAVCNPLLYHIIMSKKICCLLVAVSYFFGCVNCCTQTGFTFTLSFCAPTEINHFFCDVPAVMKASSSDTSVNEIVLQVVFGLISVTTAIIILVSYGYIVATIFRIPSGKGRHKAFSTCSSHLMAVSLFYGTAFFTYSQPGVVSSTNQGEIAAVVYAVVIPMLNPIIYSLRNVEVKEAVFRQYRKNVFPC